MFKKFSFKLSISLITIVIVIIYFFVNSIIGSDKFNYLKSILNQDQKNLIKRYIFPYKSINEKQQIISDQQQIILDQQKIINQQKKKINKQSYISLELEKKEEGSDIQIKKSIHNLRNNLILQKYLLTSAFYAGIWNEFPGSGYIDFSGEDVFVISSRGVIAYRKNLNDDKENFKQIKNNINEFISNDQFNKDKWFSLKGVLIFKNKIFISYTEEIKENCWNTSVIHGNVDYQNIIFKKLFSTDQCVNSLKNIDNEFNAFQSGGKMILFDNEHILLSIGDYRLRYLAQEKRSINGKILKINIDNNIFEIISMGHRNPQGLYFEKDNNFILEAEHGPQGGDEINLIEINNINKSEIQNYGWPISSYGEHYGGKINKNKKRYKKYPLYKSHNDYGFKEPIKSFVPSIGITNIVKIGQNKYVFSSLKDKSLYFFELNKKREIIELERIEVFERIRDLRFYKNQLYLFMEDTASIGVIRIN
tara:strand:+ start:2324 stop:3754 length:1431 start_codon:yes stop_codon:yes gene_type:complete